MSTLPAHLKLKEPATWFYIGFGLILLAPLLPIMRPLQTFIHPWRAELTASIVLLASLAYLLYNQRKNLPTFDLSKSEINFIVFPLLGFIAWSGLSVIWSPSWKSAIYHTAIWAEYLIFYLVVRQTLNKRSRLRPFLISLAVSFLIIIIPPIVEYSGFLIFGGATSLGIRYAKYGEIVNTISPLIIVGVLRLHGKRFAVGLFVVVALWLFSISTLGRTNLIISAFGLTVITAAVLIFKRFHKYRRKMITIALAIVIVPLPLHLITFLAEEPIVPLIKRINDEPSITYSSDVRKLLRSVSVEMFKTHPIIGIGADNFGMSFNEYRVNYAAKNPTDVNLMTAEVEIAERSHNEYLQILAELGTVGGLIFLWFLSGILLMSLKTLKNFRRISLTSSAALLGVGFFLASSLISSFSFRLVQNGFVFFFVLAVAAQYIFTDKSQEKESSQYIFSAGQLKLGYALGILACIVLTVNCLIRVSSVYYSNKAQAIAEIDQAIPYYQTAVWLDAENSTAYYACAMNFFYAERYAEAIPYFRQAIEAQRGLSVDYSYMATAQTLSGDNLGAEKTMAEALTLYPMSTFVRARYATLLQANGKTEAAAEQLQIARKINAPEANTWWIMMNEGPRQASLLAAQDRNFIKVTKLAPEQAIYAVVTEREILHPEEKFKIPGVDY